MDGNYRFINLRVSPEMYAEIKGTAEGRHQTITGYLLGLHRAEMERVTGRPYRLDVTQGERAAPAATE